MEDTCHVISRVTGLGVIINAQDWDLYGKKLSDAYGTTCYCGTDQNDSALFVFVYVKGTELFSSVNLSPHLDGIDDDHINHCTSITSNPELTNLYPDTIKTMRQQFDIPNDIITYYTIETSMGFVEIEDWYL